MKRLLFLLPLALLFIGWVATREANPTSWIRINQLGYLPQGTKAAVWASKENQSISSFQLVDVATGKKVFTGKAGTAFGAYGPFQQSYRLNFSAFKKPGRYYLEAGQGLPSCVPLGRARRNSRQAGASDRSCCTTPVCEPRP